MWGVGVSGSAWDVADQRSGGGPCANLSVNARLETVLDALHDDLCSVGQLEDLAGVGSRGQVYLDLACLASARFDEQGHHKRHSGSEVTRRDRDTSIGPKIERTICFPCTRAVVTCKDPPARPKNPSKGVGR